MVRFISQTSIMFLMLLFLEKYLKNWFWHQTPSPIHCSMSGGEVVVPPGSNSSGGVGWGRVLFYIKSVYAPQPPVMGGGETIDPSRQESNDLLQGSFGILGQCNSSCWWISTHSYWRLTVRGKQSLRKHEPGSVCQWIISRCVAWTPDLCSDSWSKCSLFVLCSRWHCGGHWLCFLSSLLCASPPLQPQISFILFSTSVLSSVDITLPGRMDQGGKISSSTWGRSDPLLLFCPKACFSYGAASQRITETLKSHGREAWEENRKRGDNQKPWN